MTKITTDFTGVEPSATRLSRLGSIYDFWWGAGAFVLAGTLGTVRTTMNGIAPDDTSNGEAFGSWLTKWNALNEPDKLLNDTLKDANPALFVLADDTARIFGPDGVTAVSAPGTAVSLAADDWQGITLGSDLITNGDFATDTWWSKGTGWSIAGGKATKALGVTENLSRASLLTIGRVYEVTYTVTDYVAGAVVSLLGTTSSGPSRTANGTYTERRVASGDTAFYLQGNAAFNGSIDNVSVREILNWPAYQNTASARPTWGRAPAQVRNRLRSSQDFTVFSGASSNIGVTLVDAAAPNGEATNRLIPTAVSGGHYVDTLEAGSVLVPNATNFVSLWVKPNGYDFISVEDASGISWINVNLLTGAVGITGGGAALVSRVADLDGYYKVVVSLQGAVNTRLRFSPAALGNQRPTSAWTPDGISGADFWRVQVETTSATPYQRRGALSTPDVTEAGVRSFGLLSLDGSDDALLHQLAAGGTVSVALFGRGGSYLIPSITLAAPSVLQLGPLSVLDDGVLVSGCPTGILRAVGTVPWSSKFELVGYAIMKANPSAEEKARAMRYFAAHGARGWLVEGPELVPATLFAGTGDWAALEAGWTIAGGKLNAAVTGVTRALPNPISSLVVGQHYVFAYSVDTYTSGNHSGSFSNSTPTASASTSATSGTFIEVFRPTSSGALAGVTSRLSGFTGSINSMSLKALTPEF